MNSAATFNNGFVYQCGLFQSIFDITLFGGTLYAQFDLGNYGEYEMNYLPAQALDDLRLIRSLTDSAHRMPYKTFELLDDDNYWKSQATFVQVWTTADQSLVFAKLSELCKDHNLPLPNFGDYGNEEDDLYRLHNDSWDLVCKVHLDPYESEKCRDYVLGVCLHHMMSLCTGTNTIQATFEL